jgi:hypothetical protein
LKNSFIITTKPKGYSFQNPGAYLLQNEEKFVLPFQGILWLWVSFVDL